MKTTIDIADDLLARAKEAARKDSRTLKSLIEEGLRWVLGRRTQKKPGDRPFRVKTMGGDGLTDEARQLGWARIVEAASDREQT